MGYLLLKWFIFCVSVVIFVFEGVIYFLLDSILSVVLFFLCILEYYVKYFLFIIFVCCCIVRIICCWEIRKGGIYGFWFCWLWEICLFLMVIIYWFGLIVLSIWCFWLLCVFIDRWDLEKFWINSLKWWCLGFEDVLEKNLYDCFFINFLEKFLCFIIFF